MRGPLGSYCRRFGRLTRSGGLKWPERPCGGPAVHTCRAPALPPASITVLEAVALWRKHFEERGVTEPEHSSHSIMAHLLGAKTIESLEREKLTQFLSRETAEQLWELCTKRLSRMPVQYVIEEWDFRDLTLKMRPPVFIPRPETEELVELVLTDLQMKPGSGMGAEAQCTCLEVGCGSGAISLSLLKSLPWLRTVALDQSQDAVDLTRENAFSLGLQDRLHIHHIDVLKDADSVVSLCSPVSVLVSNPPYLFSEDMTSLDPEILWFEDHVALDGGEDGLRVIKQILTLAPQILANHGRVYLEVDPRHPPLIQQWVEARVEELRYIQTQHDITGRPRFCILQKEK
ncbi:MTRF1L release factor glutamine methyltransferase [Myripristis murdjan]|uniref:peptide chain release factor N(5)-glutamine methyltransferase n=1 Tax=Myripristis murdjan TaxID=586833 RepID=A0A667XAC0_9TELE|nr:MTRF1L release factor glutamine methyltransferase [Myripristis murdjan]